MEYLLTIDDGLKRSLGYLDEDELLDPANIKRMTDCLETAESYVQNAVGTNIDDFYSQDDIKPLYQQASNALAATYYNNPASVGQLQAVPVDAVSNSIIGQLRGLYSEGVDQDGAGSQHK